MTPRGILGLSSVLLSGLFVALLVLQGRALGDQQLHGMVFAALMSLALSALVLRAKSFAAAARAYIAVLAVAVVGGIAAAVVGDRLGDVVGLLGALIAALGCAAKLVRSLKAQAVDDALISPKSVRALERLVHRVRADAHATFEALAEGSERAEPYLLQRLDQLRAELIHAERWSARMGLGRNHAARVALSSTRRLLNVR